LKSNLLLPYGVHQTRTPIEIIINASLIKLRKMDNKSALKKIQDKIQVNSTNAKKNKKNDYKLLSISDTKSDNYLFHSDKYSTQRADVLTMDHVILDLNDANDTITYVESESLFRPQKGDGSVVVGNSLFDLDKNTDETSILSQSNEIDEKNVFLKVHFSGETVILLVFCLIFIFFSFFVYLFLLEIN
jgi:hypothetical protein